MTAENPARRKLTARETAERLGVSVRTVRRIVAEPREDFLSRAQERRARAVALRAAGMSSTQIGEELGCSPSAARRLIMTARQKGEVPELTEGENTE